MLVCLTQSGSYVQEAKSKTRRLLRKFDPKHPSKTGPGAKQRLRSPARPDPRQLSDSLSLYRSLSLPLSLSLYIYIYTYT